MLILLKEIVNALMDFPFFNILSYIKEESIPPLNAKDKLTSDTRFL